MKRLAALLIGALLALPVIAGVGIVSVAIPPSADGRLWSQYIDGSAPPTTGPLAWSGVAAAIENAGSLLIETGTPFIYDDIRQHLVGDEADTATLSFLSVSGDDCATAGWSFEEVTPDETLEYDALAVGSGLCRLVATGVSSSDESGGFDWAATGTPPPGGSGYSFPQASLGTSAQSVAVVATFNNAGWEWKQTSNNTTNEAQCRYKKNSDGVWKQCLNGWWDDLSYHPADDRNEARGSIVGLQSNTAYTVELLGESTRLLGTAQFTTDNETFPLASTTTLNATYTGTTLTLSAGGSASTGYVLYTRSGGSVIDGNNTIDNCVNITGSYIILRGVEVRECREIGVAISSSAHHVVIEQNEIHNFGRQDPNSQYGCNGTGGISTTNAGSNSGVVGLIIQDNEIHTPNYDANSWGENPRPSSTGCFSPGTSHPAGSVAIFLKDSGGEHVIRYNNIYSDLTHMFDDGIGGGQNFSVNGPFPRDSDIHNNIVSHTWDDGIEAEGGNKNVRIYNNWIEQNYVALAMGCNCLGPSYVFRNITTQGLDGPGDTGGRWSKHYVKPSQTNTPGDVTLGYGRIYKFHETIYGTSAATRVNAVFNAVQPGVATGNMVGKNNIIYTNSDLSSNLDDMFKANSDFDYNLVGSGHTTWSGEGSNNQQSDPVFDGAHASGPQTLTTGSPGYDDGVSIPNFNDGTCGTGSAACNSGPDMGAVERGQTEPEYGPR